jgi:5-methyltetrahydrofolate--homocysteine methyltransferase
MPSKLASPFLEILNEGLVSAMSEMGHFFEEGEFFVPKRLTAARALQTGLALLQLRLKNAEVVSAGKVAVGTVKGDLHDIGKNLVAMMLEGAGFDIIDLGTGYPAVKIAGAVHNQDPQIVALSALLTTTMPSIEGTIKALNAARLRNKVKVVIGGAPVHQSPRAAPTKSVQKALRQTPDATLATAKALMAAR